MTEPRSLGEFVEYLIDESVEDIWTSMPAEVISVNGNTVSVRVLPLPFNEDGGLTEYPVIDNVRVAMPCGGGYGLCLNISVGEKVLLVFCTKGIGMFMQNFDMELEDGGLHDLHSAIAIPSLRMADEFSPDGISLRKLDGTVSIDLDSTSVKIKTPTNSFELKDGGETLIGTQGAKCTDTGDFITAIGTSLDNHHH
jgi:hypothetical protein